MKISYKEITEQAAKLIGEDDHMTAESTIYEAAEALAYLGFSWNNDEEYLEIPSPEEVNEIDLVVTQALDLADDPDHPSPSILPQALEYYDDLMWGRSDDVALDYHGTYVLGLIEVIQELLKLNEEGGNV